MPENRDTAREYIAFISYRHKPLDMETAVLLHRLIEHYRVPRDLCRGTARKLGYVFRDQDELPLTSDLDEDIKAALDSSRFLIVICTPDTPKSLWVEHEITYFLKHHDHNHILAVLADGSPEESFPRLLTNIYGEDGVTVTNVVEPLAANICAPTKRKRHRLMRLEYLRLAASILECSYDTLKQREKRYRQQKITAAAAAVIAAAFAGILVKKNSDINLQFAQSQQNESYALSLVSQQLLEKGDRYGAVKNALAALPSADTERPLSVEAEHALEDALYVYQDYELRADCQLEQETPIYRMVFSGDGSYAVTMDEFDCLRCFDGKTGKLIWEKRNLFHLADSLTVLDSEQAVFYSDSEEHILLSLKDGTVLNEQNYADGDSTLDVTVSDNQKIAAMRRVMERTDDSPEWKNYFCFYELPSLKLIGTTSALELPSESILLKNAVFSDDATKLAVEFYNHEDEELHIVIVLDVASASQLYSVTYEERYTFYEMNMDFLPDGDLLVFRSEYDHDDEIRQSLDRFDAHTGEPVYNREYDEAYLKLYTVPKLLFNEKTVLCVGNDHVMSFDLATGELAEREMLPMSCLACCWLEDIHQQYAIVFEDGSIDTMTTSDYDPEIEHTNKLRADLGVELDQAYAGGRDDIFICGIPDKERNRAVIFRPLGDDGGTDLEIPPLTEFDESLGYPTGSMHLSPSGGRILYTVTDISRDPFGYSYVIYDAESLEMREQLEISEAGVHGFNGFSADETKVILDGFLYDSSADTYVPFSDSEELPMYTMVHSYEQEEGKPVISACFKEAGVDEPSMLYWWEDGENRKNSACPWEGKSDFFDDDRECMAVGQGGLAAVALADGYSSFRPDGYAIMNLEEEEWTYLLNPCPEKGLPVFCAGNEKPLLAFCDYDDRLRIVDGKTGKVTKEFPLEVPADAVRNMYFLLDDTVLLILQSNNRLRIVDAEDGTMKTLVELEGFSEYEDLLLRVDEENNCLYIGESGGNMEGSCIDLATWTVRASIPGLIDYLPGTHRVLKMDIVRDKFVRFPSYTLLDLVERGEKMMSEAKIAE